MRLTVHNKIQFTVSKVCLPIHSLNLYLITMIERLKCGVCWLYQVSARHNRCRQWWTTTEIYRLWMLSRVLWTRFTCLFDAKHAP